MAVQTFSGGANYVRTFSIKRQNGANDKNGKPFFFEWLKEIPDTDPGEKRKFETRAGEDGSAKHYELFSAISGILTGIEVEGKEMLGGPEVWLCLYLSDGPEDYKIECGKIDGYYSQDVMKRLLDENFDPSQSLRLSPYAMEKDSKKGWNIGVSAYSGVDTLLRGGLNPDYPKTHNPALYGIAQPTQTPYKNDILWDFTPVAEWLIDKIREKVMPRLSNVSLSRSGDKDPVHSDRYREIERQPPVVEHHATEGQDDLPF